jgi:hypothetical protein
MKNGYNHYKNATIIVERIGRNLFVFIAIVKKTQRCRSMNIENKGATKLWIPKGILSS